MGSVPRSHSTTPLHILAPAVCPLKQGATKDPTLPQSTTNNPPSLAPRPPPLSVPICEICG